MQVKINKISDDAIVPSYQTEGAAGFDFHALEDYTINPGQTVLIQTGLAFEIPLGYELRVQPRSGMSFKTKLRVANSPGCVDSDYRGEVCVIAENTDYAIKEVVSTYDSYGGNSVRVIAGNPIVIKKGDRIAQGIISPVVRAEFIEGDLNQTIRGSGAFGSTGN
jgi:dUTP pyrophosphatase